MKSQSRILPAVLTFAALCAGGWAVQKERPKAWEYRYTGGYNELTFGQLGAQGWELAGVGCEGDGGRLYVFKRPE